jgi:hypothetical protein
MRTIDWPTTDRGDPHTATPDRAADQALHRGAGGTLADRPPRADRHPFAADREGISIARTAHQRRRISEPTHHHKDRVAASSGTPGPYYGLGQ